MKGKVIKYFPDKGFGFLKLEDGNDCYFHKSNIKEEINRIYPGDVAEVEFRESRKKPGSYEASQVLFLQELNRKQSRTPLPMDIGQIEMINEQKGYGFISTLKFGSVYFNFRILSGDRPSIEVSDAALITVRPSIRKPDSYEAVTFRPLSEISLAEIVSDAETVISEEKYDLCIRFFIERRGAARESLGEQRLSKFFERLNQDQRERAFNSWFCQEIDFYDPEYLAVKLAKMSAYDTLETVSRVDKVPIERAFILLPTDKKYDLVTGVLRGQQSYFVESYFYTIMGALSLEEVIKIVEEDAKDRSIDLVTKYLKLHYKGDFNRYDLELLINVLKSSRYSESKSVELYEIISNHLSYDQKYDLMMDCKNKEVMICDPDFLFSNLDMINIHIRFSLLKSLDAASADLLIKRSLTEIADSPEQFSIDDIIKSLNALRVWNCEYDLTNFEDVLKLKYSHEDQFELWKNGLIKEIDLDIVLFGSKTLSSKDLSRVFNFLSEEDRKTFIFNSIATILEDGVSVQSTKIFDILKLCESDSTLLFEVILHLIDSLPEPQKDTLAQSSYFDSLSNEQYELMVRRHLNREISVAPTFVAKFVFRSMKDESLHSLAIDIIKQNQNYNDLIAIITYLLKNGLCYFRKGKYAGKSVVDVWRRNPDYIRWIKMNHPSFISSINELAGRNPNFIFQVEDRTTNFIRSILLPTVQNIQFAKQKSFREIQNVISTFEVMDTSYCRLALSDADPDEIISQSFEKYFDDFNDCFVREIEQIKDSREIISLKHYVEKLDCLSRTFLREETRSRFQKQLRFQLESIKDVYTNMFVDEFSKSHRSQSNFMDNLSVFQLLWEQREYDDIDFKKKVREGFYTSCKLIVTREINGYNDICNISKWNKLREKIAQATPIVENIFPTKIFGICPFIYKLEQTRDNHLLQYLENKSIFINSFFKYSKVTEIMDELKNSYDHDKVNLLIRRLYDHSTDEFQLKLWLYEYVEIFDFERYASVYFTLNHNERRTFNKRVREITRSDLNKKLLAVRVPWGLKKSEGNETVYEATWKSVWFQDGAIRFCMDEGIFSAPYKVSYARKDFNSLYSFLSGKRGGDLTVYCLNNTIVDVQGLEELKELIQRVIITRGLTESDNFLFKSEGENRVPVNLLLKNECINVLSKLVGEGIKVHRVYEKIWKFEHGIQIPFDFDISYIFPVLTSDGRYILLWESARLEKSKATYVFSCPQDQLDEHLERIISYIDKQVNVRSAILTSTEVQSDLGFIGRIEHENFDIFPWKKRLVSYLPGYSDKIFESSETEHQ